MAELALNKVEDISKLEGWTIQKAEFVAGTDPCLKFQMQHPAAECPVNFAIVGGVQFGRSGNVMICNAVLNIRVEDVKT